MQVAVTSLTHCFPVYIVFQDTDRRLKECAKETLADLVTPLSGGWGRILGDLRIGAASFGGGGPGWLSAADFSDPALLGNLPISFARYPLSVAVRYPKVAMGAALGFAALDHARAAAQSLVSISAGRAVWSGEDSTESWILTFFIVLFEISVSLVRRLYIQNIFEADFLPASFFQIPCLLRFLDAEC